MTKLTLKNQRLLLAVISTFALNQNAFASDAIVVADASSDAALEQQFAQGMSLREAGDTTLQLLPFRVY